MSNINGASGSHYISNAEFLLWMQEKTDGIYTKMGDAMDVSNDRADAEDALNKIKADIAAVKAGKADANDLYALVNQTIDKYGAEFTELKDTLSPISQELKNMGAKLPDAPVEPDRKPYIPAPPSKKLAGDHPNAAFEKWEKEWGGLAAARPDLIIGTTPKKVTIDDGIAERWTNAIKDRVEAFGKEDQLGLINIQEYNAQLNQAKQMASALMDASDKAANSIISHIS
jgi:hypothetical protein